MYKCLICGNTISVVESHPPEIVCCNQAMSLLEVKGSDQEGKEKHVPILEVLGKEVLVSVGSIKHPMEENHFIQLIQLLKNNEVIAEARLNHTVEPIAKFVVENKDNLTVRALCNVHGLWKN